MVRTVVAQVPPALVRGIPHVPSRFGELRQPFVGIFPQLEESSVFGVSGGPIAGAMREPGDGEHVARFEHRGPFRGDVGLVQPAVDVDRLAQVAARNADACEPVAERQMIGDRHQGRVGAQARGLVFRDPKAVSAAARSPAASAISPASACCDARLISSLPGVERALGGLVRTSRLDAAGGGLDGAADQVREKRLKPPDGVGRHASTPLAGCGGRLRAPARRVPARTPAAPRRDGRRPRRPGRRTRERSGGPWRSDRQRRGSARRASEGRRSSDESPPARGRRADRASASRRQRHRTPRRIARASRARRPVRGASSRTAD